LHELLDGSRFRQSSSTRIAGAVRGRIQVPELIGVHGVKLFPDLG